MPAILVLLAILHFGPVAYSQTRSAIQPEISFGKHRQYPLMVGSSLLHARMELALMVCSKYV